MPLSSEEFGQRRQQLIHDLFVAECAGSALDIEYDYARVQADPAAVLEAIAYILENIFELPAADPERIAKGFHAMFDNGDLVFLFTERTLPVARRAAVLRQIERLYSDFLAKHCPSRLGLASRPENEMAYVCFMLCEFCPIYPGNAEPEVIDAAIAAFQQILRIENESCVEGALHALGHLVTYRRELTAVIRASIRPTWSQSLIRYAQAAADGDIL